MTLAKTVAPLLPFVAEEIHRGLTSEASVHLADWPDLATLPGDAKLVAEMDRIRDAASAARTLREKVSVRVRQPLAEMTIAGPGVSSLAPYEALLRDEVNVKSVRLAESIDEWARFQLQVNSRAAGPRLGTTMKSVLAAAKEGHFEQLGDGRVRVADQLLEAGEWQLRLEPKAGVVCEPLAAGNAIVVLDVTLSEELIAEGAARDVVRGVQQARKDAGLHVSDRIRLALVVPDEWRAAITSFRDWIAEQTLARNVEIVDALGDDTLSRHETQLGETTVSIGLAKIEEASR